MKDKRFCFEGKNADYKICTKHSFLQDGRRCQNFLLLSVDNVYNSVHNLKMIEFSNNLTVDNIFEEILFCYFFCIAFYGFVYIVYSGKSYLT